MNKKVEYKEYNNIPYLEAWLLQNDFFNSTINIKLQNKKSSSQDILLTPNYFINISHPHVYTLGKSGDDKNLLISEEDLKKINAEFIKTNRGGDITYHGPGQIIGYPILDLENFFTDIHKYINYLEEVIIKTIDHFGIKGERSQGETGVWINPNTSQARKICAIGIKASRWVTMHGFALNVNTDLKYFDYIVPCGIKNKAVTSIEKEIGQQVNLGKVNNLIKNNFLEIFGIEWI